MKTVFDTRQCAHVWAQRSQDSGRTPTRSASFTGSVFYSYATPIANFAPINAKGDVAALVTSHGYSNTTNGKHKPAVRAITAEGLQIGCHKIQWQEVDTIAPLLV